MANLFHNLILGYKSQKSDFDVPLTKKVTTRSRPHFFTCPIINVAKLASPTKTTIVQPIIPPPPPIQI